MLIFFIYPRLLNNIRQNLMETGQWVYIIHGASHVELSQKCETKDGEEQVTYSHHLIHLLPSEIPWHISQLLP